MVTRQPSFSSPTRLATGMRTSLRNSSANSVEPAMVRSGRISMPGASIGMISQVMPRCPSSPGAHQQFAVVGHLGVRGPDLRAGDHVLVAVAHRPGAQRSQVAAGVGLAEALAPHLVAAQDRRQVALLLRGRPLGDDGRSGVQQADEVDADVGRAGPLALLLEDQLLDRVSAPPAALGRPVHAGVAGLEEQALPVGVVSGAGPASPRPVVRRPRPGSVVASHGAQLVAEVLLGRAVAKIHDESDPARVP